MISADFQADSNFTGTLLHYCVDYNMETLHGISRMVLNFQ